MLERQLERVQELAVEAEVGRRRARRARRVRRVAHKRVLRVLQMHAYLMGAPCEQLAVDDRVAVVAPPVLEALEHPKRRDGLASRRRVADGHARALLLGARDGSVDHTGVVGDHAVHERQVTSVDRAIADVRHEGIARLVVLRRQHEAARVAVEAVHDAQTVVLALHVAQVLGAAVVDEGVHQRAVVMVDRRMAHEPHLLRQHDEVFVLEAYVQIDGLAAQRAGLYRLLNLVHDRVARRHGMLLRNLRAVHEHEAVVHRARSRATAWIQTARGQKRIEALTRVVGCCDVAQHAAHRASVPSPSPSDAASSADRRSSWRQLTITPTRNSTNPHVTPISATLNTGKSMNTGSMKSTT